MSERLNRTSICSVIFLDIVGYSQQPVSEQIEYKNRFNHLIGDAIKDVAQNDRIILDTGDGAAITLLGAPEEALFVSLTIRDGILKCNQEHPDMPLSVRIGINLGPVRVVKDINNHLNIIGDGINVAQRVMSFAEPNQILVSRSYYEVVSRLTNEITQMFAYSGVKHDKHVREHEVYAIRAPGDPTHAAGIAHNEAASATPKHGMTLGKKVAIGAGVAVAAVVLTVAMLSGKSQPQAGKTLDAALPGAVPVQAGTDRIVPVSTVGSSANKAKAKAENPAAKTDAAADSEKNIKRKAQPQPNKPRVVSGNVDHPAGAAAPPKQEPGRQPEKSGWDRFTESIKQG
ncbi:MAG TPA: adenylate/guanylate cyclase domain-containing protein, partial [Novimethylophilus sp.]|uniref:adenylate/guanylate cyclase domain-containing protein n=1 Tax=Novimethylophilus sp. TaxID=2137426 RepID=UPI002F3F313C